ncbi:hypothetical protein ZIOFF_006576 [Zingiber officinale]|uniref:MIR domain-containing protein n=1 Tax=Zingiber officinale TaxID=94328 RepID=A0A8J5ICW0_ZINOF|nr:hypothetical protein ZIOFF_006576 [Zingiber officinale]
MALPFVALAFFLYLTLEFPAGSPGPTVVATAEESVQPIQMNLTSAFGGNVVAPSLLAIIAKSPPESSAKQGDVIPNGTIIRLQHMRTRKWLHSHLHASPITSNLEVSCFGGEEQSDTGDFWRLEIEGNDKTWKPGERIRLQHIDTSGYLHNHDKKYTRIAGGQQEVCGIREKRPDNVWLAAEGVYLPVNNSK